MYVRALKIWSKEVIFYVLFINYLFNIVFVFPDSNSLKFNVTIDVDFVQISAAIDGQLGLYYKRDKLNIRKCLIFWP